jgi:hypothetical protein
MKIIKYTIDGKERYATPALEYLQKQGVTIQTIAAKLEKDVGTTYEIIDEKDKPTPDAAEILYEQRSRAVLSLGDVLGNMVDAGWLSEAAAEKWLDRTSLPAPLVAELASLPNPKTRLIARAALFAPSVWRLDPVWTKVFLRFGKEEAEIDAIFDIV